MSANDRLPVIDNPPQHDHGAKRVAPLRERWANYGMHAVRVLLFCLIVLAIHLHAAKRAEKVFVSSQEPPTLSLLQAWFSGANRLENAGDAVVVYDANSNVLGQVVWTSPTCDHILGFSGPTNVLIGIEGSGVLAGIQILNSGDTREHLEEIAEDTDFLRDFVGVHRDDTKVLSEIDAVSGATLTSLAIQESVVLRLGGVARSLRFPKPLAIADARSFWPKGQTLEADRQLSGYWLVLNDQHQSLGSILRTSPAADNLIGYQGPTDTRLAVDLSGNIVGMQVGESYDNEPYVGYIREDSYFLQLFNGRPIAELANLDLVEEQIEGVSGATMTSLGVAEGIQLAAAKLMSDREAQESRAMEKQAGSPLASFNWSARDLGTGLVVAWGLLLAFTSLRRNGWSRFAFQCVLVGYLGFVNGDLLSQAMFVGWAQHGIPWRSAGGLVLLSLAAVASPILTKRNIYCSQLCPHGALQQWSKNRLPWKLNVGARLSWWLRGIPGLLLGICIVIGLTGWPLSLADVEPFDAWLFPVASLASVVIAVLGILFSLFVPMGYCRFGCPTGWMLGYLRFNGRSRYWSPQDSVAALLAVAGLSILIA